MATQASVKSQTAKHNDTNSVAEPSHPVTDQLKDSLHASVDKLADDVAVRRMFSSAMLHRLQRTCQRESVWRSRNGRRQTYVNMPLKTQ